MEGIHGEKGGLSQALPLFWLLGELSGGTIPLSEDLPSAQEVMQAKLSELPVAVNEAINYEADSTNLMFAMAS